MATDKMIHIRAEGYGRVCGVLVGIKAKSVLPSRIFLSFEEDFVYKLLFYLHSLKIDPGPLNRATGFLELSNASTVNCF